jgi:hypothetical protein
VVETSKTWTPIKYISSYKKRFEILLTNHKNFRTILSIHENLKCNDTCFTSVPISDSEDSKKLLTAHAQRVISSHLRQIIWQPFSSEKNIQQENITSSLEAIAKELVKSSQPGSGIRAARVWSALTMRALHSMSPKSQGASPPRAQKFVDDVTKVLSPLIQPPTAAAFQKDLLALTDLAVSVWNSAQTGELEIQVYSDLELEARQEWRSPIFDPAENNNASVDIASSTYPRVFVLFPRVIARALTGDTKITSLPGAYPKPNGKPRIVEKCIHRGIGMAECSALVLRGKEEIELWKEEMKEEQVIFQQCLENAKKEAEEEIAKKRMSNDKRGKRGSITG